MFKFLLLILSLSRTIYSLDNGLALTPPMGWLHWERFRCVTDCVKYPNDCISETLFQAMADRMAEDGYLEAGYEFVIIDDCWLASKRDTSGRLQPDPTRFPSGIKALADYIHDKGLKFGIYADYGTNTCAGYPGSLGYLETDAQTFADWGVDYLKFDGCYAVPDNSMLEGHLEMAAYLNATGRPIVFSCEFPLYQGAEANYSVAIEACNLWRLYYDIEDSWPTVKRILDFYKQDDEFLSQQAGPGHWNDPDMLIIGNFGLSYDQSILQMAMWSALAAPLIMSNDLRTIKTDFKEILLNAEAISINQDANGNQARLLTTTDEIDIWSKPILPEVNSEPSYAVAFVSYREDGYPFRLDVSVESLGLSSNVVYNLQNVFEPSDEVSVTTEDTIVVRVNPTGAVLLKFTAVEQRK